MSEQNHSESRLVGRDLIGLLQKLAHYETAKPFTVYVDMETATPNYTDAEVSQAEQRGYDEIARRLQPARETWASLRDSLYNAGILFKETKSGRVGIKTDLELSQDQRQMYKRLDSILDEVDTFVKVR
jgi:hypothetical protein